jgi:hypothetical protein
MNEDETDRGDFYDPNGYYFDKDGYDQFGGYYDDDLNYVPGEEYKEEYFRRLKEKENEEIHYREVLHLETIMNHVKPCIEHVEKQPEE